MPDVVDLVKRVRDVSEETDRQAESLERRATQREDEAIRGENPTPSVVHDMRQNARERRADAQFLRDLAFSIEGLPMHEAAFYELAVDALR
jgi:hypothetical protein